MLQACAPSVPQGPSICVVCFETAGRCDWVVWGRQKPELVSMPLSVFLDGCEKPTLNLRGNGESRNCAAGRI